MSETRDTATDPLQNLAVTPGGRLLLLRGRYDLQAMYSGAKPPRPRVVKNYRANIAGRAAFCAARGVPYRHVVFPDPLVFAGQEIGDGVVYQSFFRAHYDFDELRGVVRYPLDEIAADPRMQRLTDTHYSPIGYMRLAASIAGDMIPGHDGFAALPADGAGWSDVVMPGDLGGRFDPPRRETLRVPPAPQVRHETNGVTSGNLGILGLMEAEAAATRRTLLIFGDSFLKSMMSELARHWHRIVLVRTPFLHPRLVAAVAPDDILTGQAERYLFAVEPDGDAVDPLAMPLLAGRGTAPTPGFADLFARLVDARRLDRGADDDGPGAIERLARAMWMEGGPGSDDVARREIRWQAHREDYLDRASRVMRRMREA